MFMKKCLSVARTRLLQLIQVLIPVTFLIVALVVSRNMDKNKTSDLPKLPLTLESYNDPVVLIQSNFNDFYSRSYLESVKGHQVKNVTSITQTMLDLVRSWPLRAKLIVVLQSSAIPSTVKRRYLVGASFTQNERNETILTAWFNNNPYHTPPLALGLMLDCVYKGVLGKNHSLSFANYPLPFTTDTKVKIFPKTTLQSTILAAATLERKRNGFPVSFQYCLQYGICVFVLYFIQRPRKSL